MQEIKKLDVLSFALLQMIVGALVGLVFGLIMVLIIAPLASSFGGGSVGLLSGMGFMGIIVLPLMYGAMGFLGGALGAWLYNMAAKWVGGVKIELV